VNLKTNSVH